MKRILFVSILFMVVGSAFAETQGAPRKLTPLTRRPGKDAVPKTAAPAPEPVEEKTVTHVTFLGPKSGWGFIQTTAPYYSPQGKRLGTLPGGTLFTYSDVKTTSKNAMLACTVRRGETREGPYLLDCTAVAAYEGQPDTLDPQTVSDLARYFTLLGKLADRKAALAEQRLEANPHYESARQAQQAYQESLAKAAEQEKQMNTLTGSRKSKALEALRAYKYEQVRIKAKADQEALAYKTWKEAHPADPAALAADPQLKALEQELLQAKAKVASLVPPAD